MNLLAKLLHQPATQSSYLSAGHKTYASRLVRHQLSSFCLLIYSCTFAGNDKKQENHDEGEHDESESEEISESDGDEERESEGDTEED